jgi:hypothetical protein
MLLPDLAGDSGEGDNSHQMTEGRQSGKAEIDGGRLLEAARGSPALPRSAVPPRRCSLMEHRQLLFDELGFEPRNVLYAAERHPFDLYRQLCDLSDRYVRALGGLCGPALHARRVSNSWRTRCSNSVGVGVISRLDGKVPAERSLQVGIRIYCSAVIRLLASEPPVDHEIDHFAQEVECG